MSIILTTRVWKDSPYKGAALVVHLALADHANNEGVCWPSQDFLAVKCRVSDRTVRTTMNQMKRDGYLKVLRRGSNFSGSSKYRLTWPTLNDAGTEPTGSLQSDNRKSVATKPELRSATTGSAV